MSWCAIVGSLRKYRALFAALFTAAERRQILVLGASTTLHGVVQVIGIASIMPFIAVVTNTQLVEQNAYLHWLYEAMNFGSHNDFLIFLGGVAFVVLLLSNAVTTFSYWLTLRFCNQLEHDLACRLLANYLDQPYEFFLRRNTTELSKVLLTEVERVVSGVLLAGIGVISDTVLTLFIVALLLVIDPWVTLVTFATLAALYGGIFLAIRGRITLLGHEFVRLNGLIFVRAKEALEGIKEIKVLGRASHFVDRYAQHSQAAARNAVSYRTMSLLPTQGLEALAFGGVIGITLYFMVSGTGTADTLALVALYAFAAYRLLPALKEIFDGVETIRYSAGALDELLADYDSSLASSTSSKPALPKLSHAVELREVEYRYPEQQSFALNGVSFTLPVGSSTCIMGDSGAGKSTTVEVMLGLLAPSGGTVLIDDQKLDQSDIQSWRSQIGYVPQVIYLMDDTVRANIALGVDMSEIEERRVELCARLAGIHDHVVGTLADGYSTRLGERGVSLSGGQRQRIGIARALYSDPSLLVLDEATNELDPASEAELLDSLRSLPGKTWLFVSHKTSVAERCDQIVLLREGRAIATGTFSQLHGTSAYFRELITGYQPRLREAR